MKVPLSQRIIHFFDECARDKYNSDAASEIFQDIKNLEMEIDKLHKKLWESETLLSSEIKLYHKEKAGLAKAQDVIKGITESLDHEMGKKWWRQEDFEASDGESGDAFDVSSEAARLIREYEAALGCSESCTKADAEGEVEK